jgi:hypothetical protein
MAKKKPARSKKTAAGRKGAHKNASKRSGATVRAKARSIPARVVAPAATLGRPKVTGDEDLDLLFKEDYHARQIFKFLSVSTVKQLEQFSAAEILRRLSRPIKETVERVRRSLAERNRCLEGDEDFALEHRAHVKDGLG